MPAPQNTVFEGIQIAIEVPFGCAQRDQLLEFMGSKFPGAEISIVHGEVGSPRVSEALFRHDSGNKSEEAESAALGGDSEAVLLKASDALAEFTKSRE